MNMAKLNVSLAFFCLFLLSSTSGGILKFTHAQEVNQETWCVAKHSAPITKLVANIEYACSTLMNCSIIQLGGLCFEPNEPGNHASVVMNLYYQKFGREVGTCDFKETGIVAITDPSYGACKYYA